MLRFPFSSLRVRLIFLVLLIAVPAIVITFYSGIRERNHARQQALDYALEMAKDISLAQERTIEGTQQMLFALSLMPQVRQRDSAACSVIFANLLKQTKVYSGILGIKPNGDVFASALPITQPTNLAFRPWFKRVLQTREFTIGEYQIGLVSGKAQVALVYPVLDDSGQITAIISPGLHLDWLNKSFEISPPPNGTNVSVLDSNGTILLRYPEPEKFVGKNISDASIFKTIFRIREGVTETVDSDGVSRLFGFTTFGKTPENVFVSVSIPKDAAFADANSAMSRNLTWLGLITVLSLLGVWLVGEFSIMDPVNRLVRATQGFGHGDLAIRTGLSHGADEIRKLALAFDGMAESVEEHARQISRQNALLNGMNELLREALVGQTEEDLGHRYLAVAEKVTQSKFGFICEINRAGLFDTIAISDPGWEACRIPKADATKLLNNLEIRGIWGRVIKEKRSMIFNDPESHPDWLNPPEDHPTITRFLGIPLKHGDETIGMIGLANKASEYDLYDQKDVETLSMVFVEALMSHRVSQAYAASERRYREVVENAVDIIYTTNINGNFTYANPAAERASGYSLKELRRLNYKDLIVPEHFDRVSGIYIDQLRQKRQVSYVEFPFVSKSGETKWFGQNASLVTESGNIKGFHIIARDITDLKRAEDALKESEKKYKDLVDNALTGVYKTNLKGDILFANEALAEMLEFGSPEEMVSVGFQTICKNSKEREELIEILEREGKIKNFELELLTKSGRTINALLSASLADNTLSGTLRDITDRKQMEEELKQSEHRYRTLINAAKDVIFTLSSKGTISTLNTAFEEIIGWPPSDWINRSFLPMIHPDDTPLANKMYEMVLKRQETPIFELRILTRGGEYIFVEFGLVPLFESGELDAVLGIARDVTERKRKEKETASLEEQLRQSQKMEAIGQLAGGVAHDFNNLLTIIKGYSQLLLMGLKDDDPLKGSIDEIQKATDRAAALTRQLLAFSRRQVMEVRVLDLHTVLKDLDKMLRRMIGEDIELVTQMAEDLGRIKVDAGQIAQVVFNLAVNARDAMPLGGKLTIETANVELDETYARNHVAVKPGRHVMLSVSDTGVGMTPEVKERIFEPFFTTKEKGKGTGLGLSTVYGIVKQSVGNIWVYSEPGQGTTIKVYFPRVDEPASELGERVKVEGIPQGKETILILEDDEGVRKLAARILEKQGYTVLEARKGDEAIKSCKERKGPIHLVLTDVVMPEMSGRQFVENLSLVRQDFKVLYMSGYTDNAIVHHGVLDEGVEFIQKPFSFEGLARKVREVLDK